MALPTRLFDQDAVWRDLGGDRRLVVEVIDLLLRDLPTNVEELLLGVERGDYAAVARAAHKVAGDASAVCAVPLKDLAKRIETHARQHSMLAITGLCAPMSESCERLMHELQAWREQLAPARPQVASLLLEPGQS